VGIRFQPFALSVHLCCLVVSAAMKEAIHSCVAAAAAEFDIAKQQAFMKAASYGKSFCVDADATEFVDVSRRLRVLNDVRKVRRRCWSERPFRARGDDFPFPAPAPIPTLSKA